MGEKPKAPENKAAKVEQPKAPENKDSKVEQPKVLENKETKVEQPKAPENKDTKVEQPKTPEYKTAQAERPKASENGETNRESKVGEDFRKQKSAQLDNEYSSIAKVYSKATELSATDETRKAAFTADYESSAKELKEKLKEDLKDIESQMAKFKGKSMEMGEYSEWKMLNSEKTKREEQLSDVEKMLDKAKNFERNNALEQSADRYNVIRGESKKDRKEDLKKDQACVRNNIATARGIRQDIADTKNEIDNVKAKLADIANTYSIDDMRSDPKLGGVYKEFTSLDRKYAVLSDKLETYEKQLNRLDDLNKKLSEIHGTDKDGHPLLEVPDLRKEVTDQNIDDAIKAVKESSEGTLLKDKLEAKDCVKALSAIDNAERVVIPAMAEQVSSLGQQISQIDSYLKNNPPDDYFTNLKAKLEKEYGDKVSKLGDLVESTTRLKTHMEVGDLKHSAKCIVNADGTYSLQQRWTNVKEKISDHGSFKNTRQFYSNAYDRVSNCKFDEKGRILSEDFSFKYKLLGYYSERKFGGEKLNLHNIFETGLLNVNAKGGWEQEKGFKIEGGASVFEIKDSATLNMLNKQVMQLNSRLSYMEAKGKAELNLEKYQMTASFSVNDGWSGGADMSIGKVKLLETAFSSMTDSISGKYDLAKAVDGKLDGIKVSSEQTDTFSYSIGDQIRMFESENKNGVVENKVFVSDITDLFGEDIGFSDIKDVYDSYTEQKESFDDVFENGIAKEEVSNKEKLVFQTKQHTDEDSKFNRAARDAKDLGERTLNGAADGEQPAWIKEADVLKAMDRTFLSLDDQKLVSETIDKIQKGEPLTKEDVDQLEYIQMQLAGNDFASEARAVSHLYSKTDMAVRDDADNVFAGAIVEKKSVLSNTEKIRTTEDGEIFLNASSEDGKADWISQDELSYAIKKSYLASDDMAFVIESAEMVKRGERISAADYDQLKYIAETLADNGYDREANAVAIMADAGKEYPQLLDNVAYSQGHNDFGAKGTCGPTSIANALNIVTGGANFDENSVMHCAMQNNLCHKGPKPSEMGGTTTDNVVALIDHIKPPESNIHTEVFENDKALSVDELADMLDKPGTVAIVGVDSATLWDRRGDVSTTGLFVHTEAPSDHWITVESPVRDKAGNVTGFTVADSGGGVHYVDRNTFEAMYRGDAQHTISDPTAIIVTNQGEAKNINNLAEGIERNSKYKGSAVESDGGDPPKEMLEVRISAEYISKEFGCDIPQTYIDQHVELYQKYFELKDKGFSIDSINEQLLVGFCKDQYLKDHERERDKLDVADVQNKIAEAFERAKKVDPSISREVYYEIKNGLIPYDPEKQFPNAFKEWMEKFDGTNTACIVNEWTHKAVSGVHKGRDAWANDAFDNCLGRSRTDGSSELYVSNYDDVLAIFTSAKTNQELATALGFKSNTYDDGAYFYGFFNNADFTYPRPTDLGANYYWAPGLRTSGGVYEAVRERVTDMDAKENVGLVSIMRK